MNTMYSRKSADISHSDLQDLEEPGHAKITDPQYLSSYNWIEADEPTIAVPGIPPRWSPPKDSQQLKKDSGFIYIAQNAARHPESPLEPLFRALYIMNPSFDMGSIDVVTDRNNIRKLFSFVTAARSRYDSESFTITAEVTNDTLIMCRDETASNVVIGSNEFRGFGNEFTKTYTTDQISDSTGHHRIISYRFGGLDFIIRHKMDGYVQTNTGLSESENLYYNLESSSSSGDQFQYVLPGVSKLRVRQQGRKMDFESALEIKTRTVNTPLPFHEAAPQLWVSQTSRLVRAYHNRGKFGVPVVEDVRAMIKHWEEASQPDLRKLGELIRRIRILVKEIGGRGVIKYDNQKDKLEIWKTDREMMLPADLYSKWNEERGCEFGHDRNSTDPKLVSQVKPETHYSGDDWVNRAHMPFSDVIKSGMDNGFRQIFRQMPTQLSDYYALCQSLNSLSIDVLQGRNIRAIMADLRKGKSDWDPDERRQVGGIKSIARDSAFRLLYIFLQEVDKESNMAYNATLFVVSHRAIFGYKTRKMVRESFADKFQISAKQRKELDKWPVGDSDFEGDDATTEEEDRYFYSDSSF